MEIQILGELIVSRDDQLAPVPAPKQRKLLALLIAHLNRSVSLDRALETLYGDALPGNATRALRFHVSKLRSALEPDVQATQRTGVIRTTPNGYQLDLEPTSIDAHRFVTLANEAAGLLPARPGDAASKIAEALELWRGEPLAEFEYDDFAQPIRSELAERKLALEETRVEAQLALGDNEGAVALLRPLIDNHPYREGLYALLMTALYRSGRQVDALAVYQEARDLLLEDLGVDPGPGLSQLEHQILTQAPGLLPPAAPGVGHNLPPDVPLVGRSDACDTLDDHMEQHRLVQITGLPGVGKSALAVARAHGLHSSFPDGTLFVRVGDDVSHRRIVEQLGTDLSAVLEQGVDDGNVIRTVAGREMLVLLDDCHRSQTAARDVITRLLADGDRVSVIATARAPISGLPGATMTLDPLDANTDGAELLRELLGESAKEDQGPRQHAVDLAAIAHAVGGLPGSIKIAAAAIRVGSAGGQSSEEIERTIMDAKTADLAGEVAGGLPVDALDLARRLACFTGGLGLDEILGIVDPALGPVTVLDSLSILTTTGVAIADPAGYRVAPVLATPFGQALPDGERRAVLGRAAERYARAAGSQIPVNAAGVVRDLVTIGDVDAAMHLIARLGPAWWQGTNRTRFAELCRAALESSDAAISHDLEATLFFATHAYLDLGEDAAALGYAAKYAEVAAALDDPSVQMHARQLRGNIDAYSGALSDARTAYADALDIGRRIGHPEVTWIAASRAAMNLLLGDALAAESGADEVAAEATIRQQPRGRALASELRGSAAFLRGDIKRALTESRTAREIAASCGAVREEIAALQRIAESHTCMSEMEEATQALADAERLVAAMGLVEPPPLTAAAVVVASDRGDADEAARRLADLKGSLQYRRPAAWIHRGLLAAAIVASAAGRESDAGLRVATLDDLGRRTGLVLPAPWEERADRIRIAGTDAEQEDGWLKKARSIDPVDLIS
ncbi:MAG: BTAD domain-containing putative transcriptional regulator [Actinomycetota bacterium]|nr:BTAD domain-containing putative transcriptional regulator [Actinomycetota bacterium]